LQRLFTAFADGWPGFGLLMQRLVTGIALLHEGIVACNGALPAAIIAPHLIGAIFGGMIVLGVWTPITGALIGAIEVWIALADTGSFETAILLATLGVTLAMVGPGAFSMDARLFGRKHIDG